MEAMLLQARRLGRPRQNLPAAHRRQDGDLVASGEGCFTPHVVAVDGESTPRQQRSELRVQRHQLLHKLRRARAGGELELHVGDADLLARPSEEADLDTDRLVAARRRH